MMLAGVGRPTNPVLTGTLMVNTNSNTMSHVKTAITVPEEVLAEIDRAARSRGESRSKYITRVLRAAMRARRDAEITRRLNELFATEDMAARQREDMELLDRVGTSWSDERW
jgi:DNA topoisomerase VI subunit B